MTKAANSISIAEYRQLIGKTNAKKNKFNARRVDNEDGSFDSTGEARRYATLQQQKHLGFIRDLKRQVSFPLYCGNQPLMLTNPETGRSRQVRYIADFTYVTIADDQFTVEDFKGHDTPLSRLKRAILATMTKAKIIVTKTAPKSPRRPYYRKEKK